MKILVANIGSTSFKFRLFDMTDEKEIARGGVERVGSQESRCYYRRAGEVDVYEELGRVRNQGQALERCLQLLASGDAPVLADPSQLSGVGFKAVMAWDLTGVQRITKKVLKAMEQCARIAPAHNPPYVRAMRVLRKRFPDLPLVASFETGFHETIPDRNRRYGVPRRWTEEYHIRRNGFHGASHEYIAGRVAKLMGRSELRVISCHLGGSSSICAIRSGKSVANSFGFSPQSGLPHCNRVGEFDPYALLVLKRRTGRSIKKLLMDLAAQGGLQGISGLDADLRDIEQAAVAGDERSQLAIDCFVSAIRHTIGAYMVELDGADVIAFTGGVGENSPHIRAAVCKDLRWSGVELDSDCNVTAAGEALVSRDSSRVAIWILPTNEELVVARHVKQLLSN